ncbi:hypothetical protein CTI12_AA271450 [Artemisia annua]|uniref:Uncharacterized protein n=1 Tax=Artemisia annua TaxID=35608 RepID=A0A2U1NFS4_ARTAN|nr:hypothetical protein CTI12_AA271450 [Artemisia annua]
MASSSRFYNTRCFQYDKHDSEDVCILKCDSKPGSLAHYAVKRAFDPCVSPTKNLFRLLNMTDAIGGVKFETHEVAGWNVVEDDKALYLLRAMTADPSKEYPSPRFTESEESVQHEEFMFAIHPTDERESVREKNMASLLHAMRQLELKQANSEPSEYYFHVMHDFSRELPRLTQPARTTCAVSFPFHVSYKLQNPQAIRIILGLGGRDAAGQETEDPFQGYAFEIFLPERLFNVQEVKQHLMSGLWKIIIPKKKIGECIQTIGGNLLFFHVKKVCKPTLWGPT